MKSAEYWLHTDRFPTVDQAYANEEFTAWVEQIQKDAYNAAIHDAASTTNSGMDNYQRIMGLLK